MFLTGRVLDEMQLVEAAEDQFWLTGVILIGVLHSCQGKVQKYTSYVTYKVDNLTMSFGR